MVENAEVEIDVKEIDLAIENTRWIQIFLILSEDHFQKFEDDCLFRISELESTVSKIQSDEIAVIYNIFRSAYDKGDYDSAIAFVQDVRDMLEYWRKK